VLRDANWQKLRLARKASASASCWPLPNHEFLLLDYRFLDRRSLDSAETKTSIATTEGRSANCYFY